MNAINQKCKTSLSSETLLVRAERGKRKLSKELCFSLRRENLDKINKLFRFCFMPKTKKKKSHLEIHGKRLSVDASTQDK